MEHHQAKELISPCGIYCGGCAYIWPRIVRRSSPCAQHGVTEDQLPVQDAVVKTGTASIWMLDASVCLRPRQRCELLL
jgi:hypothetical protein